MLASDLAKMEEKGGYIALETPPGCYRRRGFGYENKQTNKVHPILIGLDKSRDTTPCSDWMKPGCVGKE